VVVANVDLSHFVVGLTDDNPAVIPPVYKEYLHVQYDGSVKNKETATVTFPETSEHIFRYVIIQNKFNEKRAMCLAEVQVYVTGM